MIFFQNRNHVTSGSGVRERKKIMSRPARGTHAKKNPVTSGPGRMARNGEKSCHVGIVQEVPLKLLPLQGRKILSRQQATFQPHAKKNPVTSNPWTASEKKSCHVRSGSRQRKKNPVTSGRWAVHENKILSRQRPSSTFRLLT